MTPLSNKDFFQVLEPTSQWHKEVHGYTLESPLLQLSQQLEHFKAHYSKKTLSTRIRKEEVDDDCRIPLESSAEDDFEFVQRGSRAALDEQSIARVFYELPAELPLYL
jgi:hypothetical protein